MELEGLDTSGCSYLSDESTFCTESLLSTPSFTLMAESLLSPSSTYALLQHFAQNHYYLHKISNNLAPSEVVRPLLKALGRIIGKIVEVKKGKKGKKNTPSLPSAYGKGKNVSKTSSNRVDDENREWTMAFDMSKRSTGPTPVTSIHVPRNQMFGFETAQTSGSDSPLPIAPMLLGPGSRQRAIDNFGVVSFAFYPTGPPVPFVTMLPFYNFLTDSSDTPTCNFNVEEGANNSDSM
ncbi:hypothetical protein RJT34_02885 [Clitoria ternatea]|uniref:Uncharacterized protein n=1 Tax=Clitoria ternatea TaxID=43366 RepID=A0AAN9Q0P5_CLITE